MGLKSKESNKGLFIKFASYCKILDCSWRFEYNHIVGKYKAYIYDNKGMDVESNHRSSMAKAINEAMAIAGYGEGWH